MHSDDGLMKQMWVSRIFPPAHYTISNQAESGKDSAVSDYRSCRRFRYIDDALSEAVALRAGCRQHTPKTMNNRDNYQAENFSMSELKSKANIALVTGGSRGLGRNIALQLARSGNDVILTYRQQKAEGETVVAEIESLGRSAAALQLDVADTSQFSSFQQQLAHTLEGKWQRSNFDFLINNAGIDRMSSFGQTTEEAFDELMNTHFKGAYFLTQTLLPLIADGGRIINLSTGLTRFAVPGYAAYASMKGAIEVFTKYLAKELGERGIAANVVAPGAIETDFTREAFENPGLKEFIASQTALGRVGVPDDIGGVVAFLCSEAGRWVNAQRLEASGGMFL